MIKNLPIEQELNTDCKQQKISRPKSTQIFVEHLAADKIKF